MRKARHHPPSERRYQARRMVSISLFHHSFGVIQFEYIPSIQETTKDATSLRKKATYMETKERNWLTLRGLSGGRRVDPQCNASALTSAIAE